VNQNVMAVPADGGAPSVFQPNALLVGAVAGQVYWSSRLADAGFELERSLPDGGALQPLTPLGGYTVNAITAGGQALFWTETGRDALSNFVTALQSMPFDGGAISTLASDVQNGTYSSVAAAQDAVYWVHDRDIEALALDGGARETLTTLAPPLMPMALAQANGSLYWVTVVSPLQVTQLDLSSGISTPVFVDPTGAAPALTAFIDGQSAFFGLQEPVDGLNQVELFSVGLDGGPLHGLATTGIEAPLGFATDGTSLYWVQGAGTVGSSGSVVMLTPK
jgi:hypothetical protein